MPASEQYCKFNYFGQCKFGDKYQHQHIQETYTNQACNFNACRKRHSRLCRFFSQTGYCRFESSCSFLHKPGKADKILEEMKKLEKDIVDSQFSSSENATIFRSIWERAPNFEGIVAHYQFKNSYKEWKNTKRRKQAGAELGQAQLPIGIGLYCD